MTWLDTKVKSTEIESSLRNKVLDDAKINKYFELDDNTRGVDIDGYLFFPQSVDGSESFSHREFLRTKIMGGGEFTSRGQYVCKEYSFNTIIDIEPEKLDDYLNIFYEMENKVCRVTSPYMGGMFNAEVKITVTNPETSPHVIECKVDIKEIPEIMARLKGDPVIQYPSINTISDVSVRDKGTTKIEENKTDDGDIDVYDAKNSSESREF